MNYFDTELSSWVIIATVQGGIRDCGDTDFPGLYVLLDDPSVLNFIFATIGRQIVSPPAVSGQVHQNTGNHLSNV